jgi:hypothetical protein
MPLGDHAFLYVECDVPDGVTLDSWRAAKAAPRGRGRLDGLLRRSRERGAHGLDRSATARMTGGTVGNEVI